MADFEDNPELLKPGQTDTTTAVTTYNEEAENFAVQHRVNKLKQHHRRAFDLISKALKIDEEIGNKDGTTVELYKKGKKLLNLPKHIINLTLTVQNMYRN